MMDSSTRALAMAEAAVTSCNRTTWHVRHKNMESKSQERNCNEDLPSRFIIVPTRQRAGDIDMRININAIQSYSASPEHYNVQRKAKLVTHIKLFGDILIQTTLTVEQLDALIGVSFIECVD